MNQPADLLITNAAVYTVDDDQPHAEAVAVRGNRIVYVGRASDAAAWRGAKTEVIDAGGRTLLPGLIDSHFHLLWGSLKLADLQLWDAEDMAQLATLIRDHAAANPDQEWIIGSQLRYKAISPDRPLDRHFLDQLVPDRPVYLTAYDGHTVWVNTEALRRGGLLYGRELPSGHEIVMDPATGMATGELREPEAFRSIRELLPKKNDAEKRALLHKGLALCAQHGITSAHNMDTWDDSINLYAALDDLGEMTLRLYVPYDVKPETPLEALQEAAEWKRKFQSSHLRAGAIKCFMDGVLESYTALMVDEYAGAPGNRGSALFTAEHFNRIAAEADRLGLQIAVHCCGDGAVKRTLDGYAHALQRNGRRDSRHRIEHIEVIDSPDIPRFAELGVVASMQPLHSPETVHASDVWPTRAGKARWPYSFAWRTLRDAGAHLAFGSDWPVVTLDPMLGFHTALNRQPWKQGDPDQRQTLAEVIRGYTRDAAYVEFQEHEKGMVRTGMLADLVLLSEDIFATPHEEIAHVRPLLTVCDGRVVYRNV
ncbi:MAG: hydrolase [Chloroflexi bacterium]|nr:MAG: hydrolase [Chloroflexota bacterium]